MTNCYTATGTEALRTRWPFGWRLFQSFDSCRRSSVSASSSSKREPSNTSPFLLGNARIAHLCSFSGCLSYSDETALLHTPSKSFESSSISLDRWIDRTQRKEQRLSKMPLNSSRGFCSFSTCAVMSVKSTSTQRSHGGSSPVAWRQTPT